MKDMKILAVGASGHIAGLVIPALVQHGAIVRGLVRRPAQVDIAKERGAAEVAVGDLLDAASLDAAMKGVDGVFHIGPVFAPDEIDMGKNVVEAAIRAGVRKLVFSSVIHPVLSLPNHAAKAPVEEAFINSGMDFTILHPAVLFQNFAGSWSRIVEAGVLAEPWSPETKSSRVDYRDVAEVAAIAFTEDRLAYGTFELCASGIYSRRDLAAILGEVLNRKIEVGTLGADAFGDVPADMKAMFEHYNHHGLVGNPLSLRTILGREPRTIRAFFEELASADRA
jgi:uncharacterized protein YbjT (DUF2867 family)